MMGPVCHQESLECKGIIKCIFNKELVINQLYVCMSVSVCGVCDVNSGGEVLDLTTKSI